MDKMIAFCGITCTDCKAFIATRENDVAKKKAIAEEWKIKPEEVNCNGCPNPNGQHINYWDTCEIRKCGKEKGVVNCAHCSDYTCEKLEKFFEMVPDAKKRLDGIRAKL